MSLGTLQATIVVIHQERVFDSIDIHNKQLQKPSLVFLCLLCEISPPHKKVCWWKNLSVAMKVVWKELLSCLKYTYTTNSILRLVASVFFHEPHSWMLYVSCICDYCLFLQSCQYFLLLWINSKIKNWTFTQMNNK